MHAMQYTMYRHVGVIHRTPNLGLAPGLARLLLLFPRFSLNHTQNLGNYDYTYLETDLDVIMKQEF